MSRPITILRKMAKRGDQGHPAATIAFYGPDNKRASKAVLAIMLEEEDDDDPTLYRYFDDNTDVRFKIDVQRDMLARLNEHEVRTLVMLEKIFGCPHEEGIDYPEGESCPQCPFWKNRDRYEALD